MAAQQINDEEFERLEEIRRQVGEDVYYKLPQKPTSMMKDWTEWRILINDAMIEVSMKENDTRPEREVLTSSESSKTPFFFKGDMFMHGKRAKDRYGGQPITEEDDSRTKLQKKIMDSNFYLFGIPRVSQVKNCGELSYDMAKQKITSPGRQHSMFKEVQTSVHKTDENVRAVYRRRHSSLENVQNPIHEMDEKERPLYRRRHSAFENIQNPIQAMGEKERALRRHSALENKQKPIHDMEEKERALYRRRHSALENIQKPIHDMEEKERALNRRRHSALENIQNPIHDMEEKERALNRRRHSALENIQNPIHDLDEKERPLYH